MVATFEVDGTPVTTTRSGEVEFTQVAKHGNPGNGRIRINDAAGTLSIVGQKDFAATESDCATPETFDGFVGPRDYTRGPERTGTRREIDMQLEDLNSMLGHRMLRDHGTTAAQNGKRPSESVAARGAWLLSNHAMDLIADNGRCSFPSGKDMDKADYRKQFPGDVLADMSLAAGGHNYYVRNFGAGPELVFRDDNASTADTTDVRISNVIADVLGDVTGLTFYPFKDAVLHRDPGPVRSVISYDHAKGTVLERRAATETTFNGERAGSTSNSNVKTDAKARRDARKMLEELRTEEDTIDCTIQMPSSAVNLVAHGDRISVKFSHLTPEGYGEFTWCRVLECTKRPLLPAAELYDVDLTLSPQEPAEPPPAEAAIVQSVFARSSEGGINLTLPNAVTVGNLLVYVACDRGSINPSSPNYLNGALARFGSTAWTKLPNTTNRTDYEDGVAIWYKVADTAENVGWVPSSSTNMGLYEISGATITGAATLDESIQPNALTMSLGSLGTVTSGAVVIAIIAWSDQRMWGAAMPGIAPATGFVTDSFDSNYEGGAITENSPFVWIGHALGTGVALTCSITRSDAAQLSGIWMGAALLVEPL